MSNLTELVRTCKKGDDKSFEILLEKFQPLIVKHSFFNGKMDEDIKQELNLVFHKAIINLKNPTNSSVI